MSHSREIAALCPSHVLFVLAYVLMKDLCEPYHLGLDELKEEGIMEVLTRRLTKISLFFI